MENSWANRARLAGITTLFACLFLLPGLSARADEPGAVEITAKAEVREQVPTTDGRVLWRFKPAALLRKGDEVFFTLLVHNPLVVVAPSVTVTWPVPANTVYVADSANGPAAEVTYSVDGGKTFGRPRELRIVDASGTERVATTVDYTHLRWKLRYPLAPEATALVRFRAVFQ
jgi:uncharacterized repeat protein (TIGR01451 family)